jgi:dTDP-glucose pyrophosphorylase
MTDSGTPIWESTLVRPDSPLKEVIETVDRCGLQVALVVSESGELLGIMTDGNIRRSVLAGVTLDTEIRTVMNANPLTAPEGMSRSEMLSLLRSRGLHHLPVVDSQGRVVGLVTSDSLRGWDRRENWVILLAGGTGKRLRPLTEHRPKPLVPVQGRPILDHILEGLADQGFTRVFISVNYLADKIEEYAGSGERWGVDISYLTEDEPLGTAGPISVLPELPTQPIIVINGDILTQADLRCMLDFHHESGDSATMAVREYDIQIPYGVVTATAGKVDGIDEKPIHSFFVSAGIYVLSPGALSRLEPSTRCDMPTLLERLIGEGERVGTYPMREYWIDVGHLDELERANREWGV